MPDYAQLHDTLRNIANSSFLEADEADALDEAAGLLLDLATLTTLNVRLNNDDARVLRRHMKDAHRSLLDPVVDGPLPEDIGSLPAVVLAAIHTANHMVPWRDHHIDNWSSP